MRLALFLLLLSVTGCRFGEAQFTTDLETVFDPGGTVFSYLDERDANLAEDSDPRVVVAMTWIVFDPQSDLNDLDGAALSAMSHEMGLRDTLVLVFDGRGAVDAGEEFSCTKDGDVIVESSGLDARVHLAPERLTATSTFANLEPIASRSVSVVSIDVAAFDDADAVVAGRLALDFVAIEGRDGASAREGKIEGTFRAPVVDERIAESNLALLDSDDLLGLPLSPRPQP